MSHPTKGFDMTDDTQAPASGNRDRKKYEPRLRHVEIVVTPHQVKRYGAAGAVVLKQISYWSQNNGGWFEASSWDLADSTGLSPDACRREVAKLVEAGAIEKQNQRNGHGEQKARYRLSPQGKRMAIPPGRAGDSDVPPPGESAGPSSLQRSESSNTPLPPEGGDQGRLALDHEEETPIRSRRRAAAANPMLEATYDVWVKNYPSGPQRGDRKRGLAAFAKAMKVDSVETLTIQLRRYVEARELYASRVGEFPSLLNVSTFLNGRRELWSHDWTVEDCRYWPAPAGKLTAGSPRGETREELMARELAREQREAEERAAAMVDFEDDDDEEWV